MTHIALPLLACFAIGSAMEFISTAGNRTYSINDKPYSIAIKGSKTSINVKFDKLVEVVDGKEVSIKNIASNEIDLKVTNNVYDTSPKSKQTFSSVQVSDNTKFFVISRIYIEKGIDNYESIDYFDVEVGSVGMELMINEWAFTPAGASNKAVTFLDLYISVGSDFDSVDVTKPKASVITKSFGSSKVQFSRKVYLGGGVTNPPAGYPKFLPGNVVVVRFPYFEVPVLYRLSLTGGASGIGPSLLGLLVVMLTSAFLGRSL